MDYFSNPVFLSRLQFAVSTHFHIVWPVLSIGLSLFLVLTESLWFRTGRALYYRHTRFWSRIFLLNFGLGVVTGIPLEFQFGTNWSAFSVATGDFFGNILGFEGAMAFMLEAGFLGIMLFGWNRVPPPAHLFATAMVALGASLSAFWIMSANSWMHTPAGTHFENGRVVVDDYFAAIFNPAMPWALSHMWVASIETTVFVTGGVSAWYLLHRRHGDFFLESFRLSLIIAVIAAPLQILLGDRSGATVAEYQPAKLAALEGHWHTNPPGTGAPWAIVAWPDREKQANAWAIEVPNALSLLITHRLTGTVRGLGDFPREDQPPVAIPFYAFRVMVALGLLMASLVLWTLWASSRGKLAADRVHRQTALLRAWVWAIPSGYLAVEMGWLTREVGRQPWLVQGLMRTEQGATPLAAATVWTSLLGYVVILTLLFGGFIFFFRRIVQQGPDLTSPVPVLGSRGPGTSKGRKDGGAVERD
jgi:cytochrome d ubiquinol oxidase subunit I